MTGVIGLRQRHNGHSFGEVRVHVALCIVFRDLRRLHSDTGGLSGCSKLLQARTAVIASARIPRCLWLGDKHDLSTDRIYSVRLRWRVWHRSGYTSMLSVWHRCVVRFRSMGL